MRQLFVTKKYPETADFHFFCSYFPFCHEKSVKKAIFLPFFDFGAKITFLGLQKTYTNLYDSESRTQEEYV